MADNGPAFPHELAAAMDGDGSTLDAYLEIRSGTEIKADIEALTKYKTPCAMGLRDEFAKAALGTKTIGALIGYEDNAPEHRAELIRRLTRDCYEIADAMLRERERIVK